MFLYSFKTFAINVDVVEVEGDPNIQVCIGFCHLTYFHLTYHIIAYHLYQHIFDPLSSTSWAGFGWKATPVMMGGGRTTNGVETAAALMLLTATQVTLTSPSLTRKSSVETVSQADTSVSTEAELTRESVALLISHLIAGRGLPAWAVCACRWLQLLRLYRRNRSGDDIEARQNSSA